MAAAIDLGLNIILKNTSLKFFQIAASNIVNYGQLMIINDLLWLMLDYINCEDYRFLPIPHISIRKSHRALKFKAQGHWRSYEVTEGKKKFFNSGLKFYSSITPFQ